MRQSQLAALLNLAPFVAYKVEDGTDNYTRWNKGS
jgi:hypothetical protein